MLHVDIPSRADTDWLAAVRDPACLSICLPTTPLTPDVERDRLMFKNLSRDGIAELSQRCDAKRVAAIQEALDELVEDRVFWAYQANSLVVFANPDHVITFRLPHRLEPVVEVADRFFIKPLLRSMTVPQSAFVLALAQGSVRLVEVSPDMPAFAVDVPDMPADAASSVGKASITDRSPSRRIQGAEGQKVRMGQYARQVDGAIRELLGGRETPLVLAAAPPLDAIYRAANTYPFLAADGIGGNPEALTDAELATAARKVLDALLAQELKSIAALFEARAGQGRTTTDVQVAARAATWGAISLLLVDIDAVVPGTVDEEDGAVQFGEPGGSTYGVVDEIARRALSTGARVLGVRKGDLPAGDSLAAILRYPL
ncbi:MAG: hypothetical protein R2826_03325 [Thermoleophilia bacterium]